MTRCALLLALAALSALTITVCAPGVIAAQAASETAAARELYAQGVEAAQEGRLAEAIARFERSYALAPRDATLLNLAQVQERDGRIAEQQNELDEFRAGFTILTAQMREAKIEPRWQPRPKPGTVKVLPGS